MNAKLKVLIMLLVMPSYLYPQWHNVKLGIENELTDICFINDSVGFCIGDSSLLLKTDDGGKSWEKKIIELENEIHRLNRIIFFGNVGLILGNGVIYRTIDQGHNWETVLSDPLLNFLDLTSYSSNKIWISAAVSNSDNRSALFESENIGITWHKIIDTSESTRLKGYRIQGIDLLSEKDALILCSASTDPLGPTYIYRTTDNGINWNSFSENKFYTWGLVNSGSDTVWAWGTGLELSIDSGRTWNSDNFTLIDENGSAEKLEVGTILDLSKSNNSKINFLQIKIRDNQYSILVNKGNTLSWEKVNIQTINRLNSMFYINKENIWCVGFSGTLITNNNNVSSVINRPYNLAKRNLFVIGNYPNPFNPTTTISYTIPEAGYVQVKIYDVLGREVSKLVDEVKNAGRYSIDWNGSNYSSGIYFYSIRYNNQTLYKKMLMIK